MPHLNYWTYNKKERFSTLKEELEKCLEIKEMLHEQENYWEYMEGYSKRFRCRINVSRPCSDECVVAESGQDKKKEVPLHLIFYDCDPAYTDQIGNELNACFRLPVYEGIVYKIPELANEYVFIKKRSYRQIDFSGTL